MNINFTSNAMALPTAAERRVNRLGRDIRVIRICRVILTVIAILAAAIAGSDLLAPTFIATTLALVRAPAARMLERIGFPTGWQLC